MPSIVSLNEYMIYWVVGFGFLLFIGIAGVVNWFRNK
jgi:hypothetical protein